MINAEKLISQIRDIPVPDLEAATKPAAPEPPKEEKLEELTGRRCSWCAKPLRIYQMSSCKRCAYASSPPCPKGSKAHEEPDRLFRFGRGKKADADA